MAIRRKLNEALDYGRAIQPTHELQSIGENLADNDIFAVLDVSEVEADAQPKKVTASGFFASVGGLRSVTTNISGASQVTNIVSLSQAQYDAISSPDATTLYVING